MKLQIVFGIEFCQKFFWSIWDQKIKPWRQYPSCLWHSQYCYRIIKQYLWKREKFRSKVDLLDYLRIISLKKVRPKFLWFISQLCYFKKISQFFPKAWMQFLKKTLRNTQLLLYKKTELLYNRKFDSKLRDYLKKRKCRS